MGLATAKILIVDDRPANLLAFRKILQSVNADLLCVNSGSEALSAVMKHELALILMDVEMPDMDGIETTLLIRQDMAYANIPIIFVTAHDESALAQCYEAGGVDYLRKPLQEEIVVSKVNIFLQLDVQRRELIASRHEMTDFAHSAAHDLRAPLRHMRSYAQLLLDEEEDSDEERAEWLGYISSAAGRLSKLIDGMLDFAITGTDEFLPIPIPLSAVLDNVLEDLSGAVAEAEATIDVDSLPTVLGNSTLLYRVFQNVLANALKYRRKGVPPVITIRHRTLRGLGIITISDNGIGFDQKDVSRIFAPFSRLVGERDFEGSGIGMATVAKIVALLGGEITATGECGVGATFTITLPLAP